MYKIKIEDSNEQKIEIPEIPFIITHCERKSHYIVSKNSGDKYLLTAIDNGITYDNDNDYVEKLEKYTITPQGLPVMLFYPNNKDLSDDNIFQKHDMGYRVGLSVKEFFENSEEIFSKRESWELAPKSLSLVQPYLSELEKLTTSEECVKLLKEKYTDQKISDNMYSAMFRVFQTIFRERILNKDPYVFSEWKLIEEGRNIICTAHPVEIALTAGIIPCLQTGHLGDTVYLPEMVGYYLKKLTQLKQSTQTLKEKRMLLIVDECHDICKPMEMSDGRVANNPASVMLAKYARKGRHFKAGLIWASQQPQDIDKAIYAQTQIIYCFMLKEDDAKMVSKSFHMGKNAWKDIASLHKGENIMQSDVDLIHYDVDGERKIWPAKKESFGYSLPPSSHHLMPGEKP